MTIGLTLRGLESVSRQLRRYNEEMNGALDEGTKNAASAIRNAVRAELRTEGTGREYPSRRTRAVREIERKNAETRLEIETGIGLSYNGNGGETLSRRQLGYRKQVLAGGERRLARAIKKIEKLKGKQGRPSDTHRASVVGRAPAPDVGLLPQAVKAGKREGAYRVGVGGKWEGWEALHEGRGRLTGPRPFLLLGVARIKDRLAGIWVRTVQKRRGDA